MVVREIVRDIPDFSQASVGLTAGYMGPVATIAGRKKPSSVASILIALPRKLVHHVSRAGWPAEPTKGVNERARGDRCHEKPCRENSKHEDQLRELRARLARRPYSIRVLL
jgi:hypothetical protein